MQIQSSNAIHMVSSSRIHLWKWNSRLYSNSVLLYTISQVTNFCLQFNDMFYQSSTGLHPASIFHSSLFIQPIQIINNKITDIISKKMKSTKICVRLWFRLSTNRFLFTRPENQFIPILYHPCPWIKNIYWSTDVDENGIALKETEKKDFLGKKHRRKDFQLIQLPSLFSFVSVSAMLIRRSQYICGTLPQESRKKTRNSLSFHIMDVSSNRLYYC